MLQPITGARALYEPEAVPGGSRLTLLVVLATGLVLAGAVGLLFWYKLLREVPTYYADPNDHFKYGSIGNEANGGIRTWIWPRCPACSRPLARRWRLCVTRHGLRARRMEGWPVGGRRGAGRVLEKDDRLSARWR